VTPDLIDKYSSPVPRYTSYPTTPHFDAAIGNDTYRAWLAALPAEATLSLYLHIPFCDRLCWFCGCHTKQTHRYAPVARYLGALGHEIAAVAGALDGRGRVTAIHLGGGSPTLLSPDDLRHLAGMLGQAFPVADTVEFSVEIDPNDMNAAKIDALAEIGITRASLGVQDFDPRVQAAINRIQSFADTRAVVDALRARGVGSVNLDLLYGLPFQSVETLLASVDQVISLRPERIALFGYAHVPWMKKHQTQIADDTLPDVYQRFEQAQAAAERIVAAGYERIGLDHFALPGDALARAARQGRLRRNFQGYTVDEADALLGFGASSIGKLPQGYVQNTVATGMYEQQVEKDGVAVARGFALRPSDRVRSYAIERLMCGLGFTPAELRARFGADAEPVIREARLVAGFDWNGFVTMDERGFRVTEAGRPFVRTVAAAFDAYLGQGTARHSVAV